MLNKIFGFLSRDTSSLSTTGFILIIVGAFLFVALNIFLIKVCKEIVRCTGKSSHTYIKLVMIALIPTIFNVAAIFDYVLPVNLVLILTAVMCIIVVIWNCMVFGPIGGLMFSFLHIVGGLAAGLLIAGFVLMAVFMLVVMIIKPFEMPTSGAGGAIPEYVRDVDTGESFYVTTTASNQPMIDRGDWVVLYPGDYAGRYHDSNGHNYISCES